MNRDDQFDYITKLCNSVFFNQGYIECPILTHQQWDDLLSLASEQGVLPCIISLLEKAEMADLETRMVVVEWFAVSQVNTQNYHKTIAAMQRLAKILERNNLDVLFLKGVDLAQLYPKPEWRVFGDIDYFLFGNSNQGLKALEMSGIESSAYYHHHTLAFLDGVLLENHYDFIDRVNHKCNHILDKELKELADIEGHSIKAKFLGHDMRNAYVMTPTMNAIFLMRHMSAHFASETVSLRMIYDWVLFLEKSSKEVNWERVISLYKISGMAEFASIIQGIIIYNLCVNIAYCPIKPIINEKTKMVWNSIIYPIVPIQRNNIFAHAFFKIRIFMSNKWKHKIVYPDESYFLLFLRYSWLVLKGKVNFFKCR